MRWMLWGAVRVLGGAVLDLGYKLYWAGKSGQHRQMKRNKLL